MGDLSMKEDTLANVEEFVRDNISTWIKESQIDNLSRDRQSADKHTELLDRIKHVEDGIKHQGVLIEKNIHMMDQRFEQMQHTMDKQFEQVDKRLDQMQHNMDKRLEQIQHYMDKRFEQVDKRFEQVDKRFEQVDKRFEQVDKRFEQMFDEMGRRFGQVDLRFKQMFAYFTTAFFVFGISLSLLTFFTR